MMLRHSAQTDSFLALVLPGLAQKKLCTRNAVSDHAYGGPNINYDHAHVTE